MSYPAKHFLFYGATGGGKSTLAATFPKPMLVLCFDRRGKISPYTRRGIEMPEESGHFGQSIFRVMSKNDPSKLTIQVEVFEDEIVEMPIDPTSADPKMAERTPFGGFKPMAFRRYLARCPSMFDEIRNGEWATVVVDSLTYMQMATHALHRFDLNKSNLDDRRWDKLATDDLVAALCQRLTTMRCNLIVLAHVDRRGEFSDAKDKDKPRSHKDKVAGVAVYQVAAPGRLNTADALPAAFPEMYVVHKSRGKDGKMEFFLQTELDNLYNCNTSIDAPNMIQLTGTTKDYEAIWSNYRR